MEQPQQPIKVAILGGGMGGLSAAFALVRDPVEAARYEITVYERGFRLGGKGASGRNRAVRDRIEEHGLHVLMGFYNHAFRVIRECYEELRAASVLPSPPIDAPWWTGVLSPCDDAFMAEPRPGGAWETWRVPFPENDRVPGDGAETPSLLTLFLRLFRWFADSSARAPGAPSTSLFDLGLPDAMEAAEHMFVNALEEGDRADRFADAIDDFLRSTWENVKDRVDDSTVVRRAWVTLHLGGATLSGMLRDRVFSPAFDFPALDEIDHKAWLRRRAPVPDCPPSLFEDSPPVNAVYDLIFSQERGFASGTLLYDSLSMLFGYHGHIYYKMVAGMGDIVFAPLYLFLARRGVRFRFFHRTAGLHLSEDGASVAAVSGYLDPSPVPPEDYEPLVWLNGIPCWPSEPNGMATAPVEPPATERAANTSEFRLEQGSDFDVLVLAISVGALEGLCGELVAANNRFARMVRGVQTTRTQAVQLWFRPSLRELGWSMPSPVMGSFTRPFNSWADMSQVLGAEGWPARSSDAETPSSLAYLCDTLSDDVPAETALQGVKESAIRWLEGDARTLWPKAYGFAGFEWSLLVDPNGGSGRDRMDGQYWRANTDLSDRYVLATPGSSKHRLDPCNSGFENLYLAGDWVKTPLNAGCLEAAVMGGTAAGEAIAKRAKLGAPIEDPGAGYASYVERDGDWVQRHPVRLEQATIHSFLLDCSQDKLAALCHETITRPSGGAISATPAAPYVLLACADVARVRSADRRDGAKGYFPEKDVGFWVPVLLRTGDVTRTAWLLPYLFVDSAPGMAAGREIYGFPKNLASIAAHSGPSGRTLFTVDADVLTRHGRDSMVDTQRVVEVHGSLPTAREGVWASLLEARVDWRKRVCEVAESLLEKDTVDAAMRAFSLESAIGEVPIVFLKQFRDIEDRRKACYQAIVQAIGTVRELCSGGRLDGDFEVRLPRYASLSIADRLGLPLRAPVRSAFWAELDFELGEGSVLWSATLPPRP